MGLTRTVRAPIQKLLSSKRTAESIGIMTDIVVGGLLGTTSFMIVSPHCMTPGNPAAGNHPEAALLAGLALSGAWWVLTGENYSLISGLGTTLALYGVCKLFL
jgi:hypothetical protein